MLAYFARRIVGGVVMFFLAGLVMHTIVLYTPGGAKDLFTLDIHHYVTPAYAVHPWYVSDFQKQFVVDKPWPVGYLAWLFDPSNTIERRYDMEGNVYTSTKGIVFLDIKGSGILTGDLGESISVEQGRSVTDLFGEGLGEFLLLAVLMLSISMSMVAVQRRRRQLVYGLPNYPHARNLLGYACPARVPGI